MIKKSRSHGELEAQVAAPSEVTPVAPRIPHPPLVSSSTGTFLASGSHLSPAGGEGGKPGHERGLSDSLRNIPRSISSASLKNIFHHGSTQSSPKLKRNDSFMHLTAMAAETPHFRYRLQDFETIRQIGSGAYGRVQLCKHKPTNEVVVLKTVKLNELLKNRETFVCIKEEFKTLLELVQLDIPFTVKILGAFHDLAQLHFVMEHVAGGEVFAQLMASRKGHFSNERAVFIAAEVLLALKFMHEQAHVLYRDLKTENIMIDGDGHVKIIDFGLVKHLMPGERTRTFVGTPDYMSPEMVQGLAYGYEADMWAFGILIFEMLMGAPPFKTTGRDGQVTFQNIIKTHYCVPMHKDVTADARDLLLRLLNPDITKRMGVRGGWAEIMAHKWFAGINWDDLLHKRTKPPPKHRFQKGVVDVQGTVQREKRKAKASVLGRVDDADLRLFDDFDTVVRLSQNELEQKGRKMSVLQVDEHDHS